MKYKLTYKKKRSAIYAVIKANNKTFEVSTGIRISIEEWDNEQRRILTSTGGASRSQVLNNLQGDLDVITDRLNRLKRLYEFNPLAISKESVLKTIKHGTMPDENYGEIQLSDVLIKGYDMIAKEPGRSNKTLKNYHLAFQYFRDYAAEKDILLSAVTKGYLQDYKNHIDHKLGTANSKKASFQMSMTIFKKANEHYKERKFRAYDGAYPSNEFALTKKEQQNHGKVAHLKVSEVSHLMLQGFKNKDMQYYALCMLAQCYTGLSYVDLIDFDPEEHIIRDRNGKEWIVKHRQKTLHRKDPSVQNILILPELKEIMSRIDFINQKCVITRAGKFFKVGHLSTYNREIDKILRYVGIDKKITSHDLRRSFGYVLKSKNFDVEAIQFMLGHKSIVTTQQMYFKYEREMLSADRKYLISKSLEKFVNHN
jgi:integrase/recombinase XerD